MKKVITTFLAILLILCSLCFFVGCENKSETYEKFNEGNWQIAYSEKLNNAMAGNYNWDGDFSNMNIVIPNTFKDAPVTSLGGIVKNRAFRFGINYSLFQSSTIYSIKGNTAVEVQDYIDEKCSEVTNCAVIDFVFNLYIGDNLAEFEFEQSQEPLKKLQYGKNEDGTYTAYLQCFIVIVDENNQHFYSDDLGRLFYKDTNKLVTHLIYHNRDTFPEGSLPTE